LTKYILGLSHKVIVLSDKQKKEFEVISKKPCFVLHNTIETEYTPEIKQRQNFRFIYISNYLVDKGIIDLLEVFRKLMKQYKNIVLQTFGAFSDNTIKETISKYNSDRIVINGVISGIDKYKLMADSDCLILPSWNEGQPLVLLEAMSLGTPVIASQAGLIRDMVGADYPYLTIPGSRESLEEKMIQFIMQGDSAQISAVLKERYNNYFSHSKHYVNLLEIFS
jgi:glycosyltransferase involved in cell wall biosynthesis